MTFMDPHFADAGRNDPPEPEPAPRVRIPLPDDGCISLPDGSCVGFSGCMHDPRTDIGGEA